MQLSQEEFSRLGAIYFSHYGSLARLLVDTDRGPEAWYILETARASALRSMVSQRDTTPDAIPAGLWYSKARAERRIARIEGRLAGLDPIAQQERLLRYRAQLSEAEGQLDAIMVSIREAAPRYAEFSTPEALDLAQLRQSIGAGTIVLSYTVGSSDSRLLLVGAAADGGPEIRADFIPAGEGELSRRVGALNAFIARGKVVADVDPALLTQATALFELLVGPAFDAVAGADRVLIVPDGPLVDLSFAALVLPGNPARFLGHWKPLFVNPSASVFVELKARRQSRDDRPSRIAVFGDPHYARRGDVDERVVLQPLPGSRDEVRFIETLFGDRTVVFLGEAATEGNLREHSRGVGVLHCAVHAITDTQLPMDSALYFSLPERVVGPQNDGALRAWEVVDTIDTDAELVVLSACKSGHGRALAGEGIIGLARAFHYAGARTLVVSQWAVSDRSTAEFMAWFYSYLKAGASAAEALRLAQQATAVSSGMAHPYHWASFQVRGDWW